MGVLRVVGALSAAAAASVVLLVTGGCSCRDEEPVPVRVVQQEAPPPPAPAEQPAERPAAKPQRQVGDSVLRGPGDYLYTATVTAPRHIKKTAAEAYLTNEIKQFHALEGRWPKSLEELEQWRGEPLQAPPGGTKYSYDAKTGELTLVPAD